MTQNPQNPSVLFAMRYPNDIGYVWNTIARSRDLAASHLKHLADCFVAYPELTPNPAYRTVHLAPVELDCYDTSSANLQLLDQFIRRHNVRVVVFMSALPTTLNMSFFHGLGVRTINTENDSFDHAKRDPLLRRLGKYVTRRILKRQIHDVHLANAESQRQFLLRYALIPPERMMLIHDGIDCDRFSPGDRLQACIQLGLNPQRQWVINVCQARPEKRMDLMIRIARRVIDARPGHDVGFIYVGDGPCLPQWRQLAADLNLGDRFLFAGAQADLVPYYRAAHIMAHAARHESFGLAIVEAMSCGLPVVASAATGPRETVRSGETGFLVELDDDEGFTNAILRYMDDERLRVQHGRNARERARAFFNIERQGKEMAAAIAGLLSI
jgi:glycosyltransferase involved in cell wall biosynthesis